MTRARLALSMLLAAAAAASGGWDAPLLVLAILAGIVVHWAVHRGFRTALWLAGPVLLFSAVLIVLQWVGGAADIRLPMRTVAVFLLTTGAFRVLPWSAMAGGISSRSRLYMPVLFLLFVRHFAEILLAEARRALQARSLCISRSFGRAAFSSLAWAIAALFRRALQRAERFYAAQIVGGLAE